MNNTLFSINFSMLQRNVKQSKKSQRSTGSTMNGLLGFKYLNP